MGDAEWAIDNGLDPFIQPDGTEWENGNPIYNYDNDYYDDFEISDENILDEIIFELIDIKQNIKNLQEKEKELKSNLKVMLELNSTLEVDDAFIEYKLYQIPKSFNRLEVLDYVRKNYGEPIAKKIDDHCTHGGIGKPTIYIKLKEKIDKQDNNLNDSEIPF